MFERFTRAARDAVVAAQQHAREAQHAKIGATDLLAAVLDDTSGIPALVLRDLGVASADPTVVAEQPFDPGDAAALGSLGIDLDAVAARATCRSTPRRSPPSSTPSGRPWPRATTSSAPSTSSWASSPRSRGVRCGRCGGWA
jgi:hypothetical protein